MSGIRKGLITGVSTLAWDAIEMLPTIRVAEYVAAKGGPPDYLRDNWERIVEPAIRMAQLAAEQQA
jgi:electron transport complex protein RnfB